MVHIFAHSSLDVEQLESRFNSGVLPVLIIPTTGIKYSLIQDVAEYLKDQAEKTKTKFPILADIASKLYGVSAAGNQWVEDCLTAFTTIYELNYNLTSQGLEGIVHVTIKPAPLWDYTTEKRWNPDEHDLLASPINLRGYEKRFQKLKHNLEHIAYMADKYGLKLSVETEQPSYFVSRPKDTEIPAGFLEKHNIPETDPRLGTAYFPWHVQCLSVGCNAKSLNQLLKGTDIGVMLDAEHWQMTAAASHRYFLPENKYLTAEQKEFVHKFGYLVKKGKPLLFERVIDLPHELLKIKKSHEIVGLHVPGYTDYPISVLDGGKLLIGETWPIIFNSEKMKEVKKFAEQRGESFEFANLSGIVQSKNIREWVGQQVYHNLSYLFSVAKPTNGFYIIEQKVRPCLHSGPEYEKYLRTSRICLEYLLNNIRDCKK